MSPHTHDTRAAAATMSALPMQQLLFAILLFLALAYQSEATYGYGPTPDVVIKEKGYPLEVRNATTADGFVLTLFRILGGRNEKPGATNKKAILVMPGIASNCGVFILQSDTSLPLILADAGFDVWLASFRGTQSSRENVNFSDDSYEFWNSSIQETGEFDLPAIVEHMKEATGLERILYTAHSMGAAALAIHLSMRPEQAKSFEHAYLFAPAVFLGNITSSLAKFAPEAPLLAEGIKLTNHGEVPFASPAVRAAIVTLCSLFPDVCTAQRNSLSGQGTADPDKVKYFYKYFPDSFPVGQIQQYAQGVHKRKYFKKLDYGKEKNLMVYGSASPPAYNLTNVVCCVSLFYGPTDALVSKLDTIDLSIVLPNVKRLESAYNGTFSHFDFLAGKYSPQFYFKLLHHIKNDLENPNNCSHFMN